MRGSQSAFAARFAGAVERSSWRAALRDSRSRIWELIFKKEKRKKERKKGCLFLETDDGGPFFLEDGSGLGGRVWRVIDAGVGLEGVEGVSEVVGEEIVEYCPVSVLCRYHSRCPINFQDHIQVLPLSLR